MLFKSGSLVSAGLARIELETQWRTRVSHAYMRYQEKAAICDALRAELFNPGFTDPAAWLTNVHACRLASDALQEYVQIVRTYVDFVRTGNGPEARSPKVQARVEDGGTRSRELLSGTRGDYASRAREAKHDN